MTIYSPVAIPTIVGPASLKWGTRNRVIVSESPFTGQQQVIAHQGKLWYGVVTLPPMDRATANEWITWMISLNGPEKTFLMGDIMSATPLGSMAGESNHNLIQWSEALDDAVWSTAAGGTGVAPVVTANTITDPNSGATADSVVFDSGAGGAASDYSILDNGAGYTSIVGDPYYGDIYIKSAAGGEVMEMRHAGKSGYLTINVTTSWQRVGRAEKSTGAYVPLRINRRGSTATGAATIHLWGAQMVAGDKQKTYNKTVANPQAIAVNGASQTGTALIINGAGASETGWAKAGDYIQLGHGSNSHLHMVVTDADSDSSGNVTLDIWPPLRESPADNDNVIVDDAKGVFRLATSSVEWDIGLAETVGMSFPIVEALV